MHQRGAMEVTIKADNLMWVVKPVRSGRLVAWCDPLGLTIEGDSEADLASMIQEAMHELFVDLLEDGELEQFLRDRGWNALTPIPARMPEQGIVFDVPYATRREALRAAG